MPPGGVPSGLAPLLRFKLLDECSEMRGDGRRQGVVLVSERSPNCGPPKASIASGIHPAFRGVRNDMPTNPVVDPVSCGGEMEHGSLLTSPPPVPRQLSNTRTVGLVPDKGNFDAQLGE